MNFTPIPDGDKSLFISEKTLVNMPDCIYREYIENALKDHAKTFPDKIEIDSISFSVDAELVRCALKKNDAQESSYGTTEVFGERIKVQNCPTDLPCDISEGYVIDFGVNTRVYTASERGFIIALSTLMYLSDKGLIKDGVISDIPASPERGYRIYMPGRNTLPDFEKMLDLLVYYKYNSIILEIGGAMEYERHPRINSEWVKFSEDVSRYSGRSEEIQYCQHWKKNSIHYENGDGSYLTKDECRELAKKCRERGIEIIPECPTLSHADYICLAYPEIAERQDDPYPDTYCPNHPLTYRIVFDILDEVIEVFRPSRINIGHDEFYTVGICDRCRGKDPSQIYANDVSTINEYLKKRGVKTLMWAEKLLKARMNYNGYKIGGWYDEADCNGVKFQVPDMYRCADLLPQDVTYIHWYWEFGEHLDDEFHCRNLKVVFGNFSAGRCVHFRERIKRGVQGAFVSNWGSLEEEYMQRNMQYFSLITSAYALTSHTYDSKDAKDVSEIALAEMYDTYRSKIKNPLKVTHTAHYLPKKEAFFCGIFITDEKYLLGHYKVEYEDGQTFTLPVKYGKNIGPNDKNASLASVRESSYSTRSIPTDDGYLYEHTYEDPNPDSRIKDISYIPCGGKENVRVDFKFDI